MFLRAVFDAGLPPIRLHDLRHGAATLAHASGADLKAIQSLLRHASYAITADTYTSVLDEVSEALAEGIATVVPRRAVAGLSETLGLTTVSQLPAER